jgi:hypothetical protein
MVGPLAQLNSFGNFTDTFYVARDKAYIIGNIQDYIRSNLPHFMDIKASDYYLDLQDSLVLKHLSYYNHFSVDALKGSDFYSIIDLYVTNM